MKVEMNVEAGERARGVEEFERAGLIKAFLEMTAELKQSRMPLPTVMVLTDPEGSVLAYEEMKVTDDLFHADFFETGRRMIASELQPNAFSAALHSGEAEQCLSSPSSEWKGYATLAVPLLQEGELSCVLGAIVGERELPEAQAAIDCGKVTFRALSRVILASNAKNQDEQNQYQMRERLFEFTKQLHEMINVESVLKAVIEQMEKLYPQSTVKLWLSQDNQVNHLPVNLLSLQDDCNLLTKRAFIEGKAVYDSGSGEERVAAPLLGKQAVYGVLELVSSSDSYWSEADVKLISLMADSAGTAFENAKLYEQSNLLISELRLINEITRSLNKSLKPDEIYSFANKELIDIFNAHYCCILEMDQQQRHMVIRSSNLPDMGEEVFSLNYGFCGLVYNSKEPVILADYKKDVHVKSRFMEVTEASSVMASPIIVQSEVIGVILLAHRSANYFSYNNYRLFQVICGHIGLAMMNATLHAEVKRMVITDRLTGLYARHYLDEQINVMQKKDFHGGLIVVDIDFFKKVNDTYGHQIGDKILTRVSQLIQDSIREKDIAARWGGEEIAIYLPSAKLEDTMKVAERIRQRVMDDTEPKVTVSCGVSQWSWHDDKVSSESLFYRADMALYEAKKAGRNVVKVGL
ncbi:sensor domain-containing diguanylate cyclase [Marinicrinis sediminis]|uniref:Sensor domain-containing diguanylate cyclase n=1 Tax=Marinicrinis sediminis TaxID=1652465 RepID=A0ABW5R6Q0_9BACL